jgi:hypothetical protein
VESYVCIVHHKHRSVYWNCVQQAMEAAWLLIRNCTFTCVNMKKMVNTVDSVGKLHGCISKWYDFLTYVFHLILFINIKWLSLEWNRDWDLNFIYKSIFRYTVLQCMINYLFCHGLYYFAKRNSEKYGMSRELVKYSKMSSISYNSAWRLESIFNTYINKYCID